MSPGSRSTASRGSSSIGRRRAQRKRMRSLRTSRATATSMAQHKRQPDTQWPADKVERRAVDKLIPHARNVRTHTEAQVDQIAASIHQWGWTTPVLVTEQGMIIA